MSFGFFETRDERAKGKARALTDDDRQIIAKTSDSIIRDLNRHAKNPGMPAAGSPSPAIYLLGDSPSEADDEAGEYFAGSSGLFLRECLGRHAEHSRRNATISTRLPPGRKATGVELEAFRPHVVADIEATKPKVLVTVGQVATSWALGAVGAIGVLRGRIFPARIGNHVCWVCPILSPAYVLQQSGGRAKKRDMWANVFQRDIDRVIAATKYPPPVVNVWTPEKLAEGVKLCKTLESVKKALAWLDTQDVVAVDIETTALRPYAAGANILTIAVGTADRIYVIPIDHREAPWTLDERELLRELLTAWLTNGRPLVAHNLAFELEWFVHRYGPQVARGRDWDDTLVQAYCLDERMGGHSLDFLCRLHYGVPLKALVPVTASKLAEEYLTRLALYNAGDVRFTAKLYRSQTKALANARLERIYEDQILRIPTLVLTQTAGIEIDVKLAAETAEQYERQLTKTKLEILRDPTVVEYSSKFGPFLPTSSHHLNKLFKDMLGRSEGVRAPSRKRVGDYAVDKAALEAMGDLPLAKLILKLREVSKLKTTYVDVLLEGNEGYVVFPDGKLHTIFNSTSTVTGRLSSESPNLQNWPKRRNAQVRQMFVAGDGYWFVDADYGQIEARVVAMASHDKKFVDAIWHGYDIHLEWAEKIAARWPATFERRGSNMKAFRSDIKNQFTFPLLYGAGVPKISTLLEMPEDIGKELFDEFWQVFTGVRKWQKTLINEYWDRGYVETLTGRRRHAPLTTNMILNTPIQGGASDIVIDAMNRASTAAFTEDKPWLQPVLQVHDQIVWRVPDAHLEDAIEDIVNLMTNTSYSWVTVPLEIDVSYGRDWYNLKHIGKFDSRG